MTPELSIVANPSPRSSRAVRRAVTLGAALMVLIGLLLLYLLTQATNNRELYERNYARLFVVNMVVATVLGVAIAWAGYRLVTRLRQGRFGSRLLLKLATIFALVGVVPGLLIYVVSYQFVSRSIETWFDVKVEGALDAGLSLGRVTLETLSAELANKARMATSQLIESSDQSAGEVAERLLDQLGATDITVWTGSGRLVASVGQSRFQVSPDKPTTAQFRTARTERSLAWVDGLDDAVPEALARAQIKALVPIPSSQLGVSAESRYLLVSRTLPAGLVANAVAVETANREYQERALARQGLRRMYIGTLTLSLFLAVFGAVLLAVILGNQIAKPLLLLTEGVSQVAAGDLTPKLALQGRDELGGLTRAFASMTQQLADARRSVEASMSEVDAARANLQTILDNLTSGVMVLEPSGTIVLSNPGATRILQLPMDSFAGQRISDVPGLEAFGLAVQSQFEQYLSGRAEHGLDHWQQSFELGGTSAMQSPFERAVTLVVRGAELPGTQRLLVLDDISEIVSAQRAQAWGEVARRLAHEIKNPLTPIQLSAERLEMKLASKLEGTELGILNRSVKTIVEQVGAMKRLVNEFRDYARLPSAELKSVDLNALVLDVLQLYESETRKVLVTADLAPDCPRVCCDAQQLRQVIHNLVQNAQDATEAAALPELGRVTIRTKVLANADRVRLSVQDQGGGFPEHILKRAFEPYVTSKAKGTGLGLAVVKKIADEHGTRVDITNRIVDGKVEGAQVSLSLAVDHSAQV